MITKLLVCGAILFGACLGSAASASADPSVFGVLSCGCPDVSPPNSTARAQNVDKGIQHGLSSVPSGNPVE